MSSSVKQSSNLPIVYNLNNTIIENKNASIIVLFSGVPHAAASAGFSVNVNTFSIYLSTGSRSRNTPRSLNATSTACLMSAPASSMSTIRRGAKRCGCTCGHCSAAFGNITRSSVTSAFTSWAARCGANTSRCPRRRSEEAGLNSSNIKRGSWRQRSISSHPTDAAKY